MSILKKYIENLFESVNNNPLEEAAGEKLVKTISGEVGRSVKVYFNRDNDEYVAKLFVNGKHYEPADYFTDDRDDAIETATHMAKEPKKK